MSKQKLLKRWNDAWKGLSKFLTYLAKKDVQIKLILRFHFMPDRMAKIHKGNDSSYCHRMWRKRNTYSLSVGIQTGTTIIHNNI